MLSSRFCTKILMALLMLGLSSCLRPSSNPTSPGVTEDTTADFRVKTVTGKAEVSSRDSDWNTPTQKQYQYTLCLESRVTNTKLPIGQKFRITDSKNISKEIKTDNEGCLYWTETVNFNYSADSTYIEMKRKVMGMGTYRGTSIINFAINPWLNLQKRPEAGREVVDLNRGNNQIPEDRMIKAEAADGALVGLFSEKSSRELRLELLPGLDIVETGGTPNGKKFTIIAQFKPYIEPLDMVGDQIKTPLTQGSFNVRIQLVANYVGETNDPQKLLMTPELEPKDIEIKTDGTIVFKQENVPLNRQVTTGQIQLAVRITPNKPPFPMKGYDGLYNVGYFKQVFGKKWVTQLKGSQDTEGFNYGEFIKEDPNLFEQLKATGWAHDLPAVEYSNLEPRFVQVKQGETATERTIIYRVATKVTDGVTGDPVIKQPFHIVHPKESCRGDTIENVVSRNADGTCVQREDTDHNGFLYWRDELTHRYYEREHRIDQNFKITHLASKRPDVHTIALNPWDEGWTFGGDIRSKIKSSDKVYQDSKPNLLFIDAFRYQTIRFRYVIDEFLTLNVKKAVVMALDPLVQRDTLYRGRIFEPLRDGVYLAKIALVKYYIDPYKNGVHLINCKGGPGKCTDENKAIGDNRQDEYHIMPVSDGGDARKGEYTTVIKKLIRVQAGRITTPLEFSMRDLRMMTIRSQIMLQLETIDERALLRDNIVEQKLKDLERFYMELYPEDMTEEEKETFFARYGKLPEELTEEEREKIIKERRETFKEEEKKLLSFVDETKEKLESRRAQISSAQKKRFDLIDRIEKGQEQGSSQVELEKENTEVAPLRREEWRTLIAEARKNMSQMELTMKEHWSEWADGYENYVETISNDGYAQSIKEHRKTYFDYLSVMQTFFEDHGFEDTVVTENDLDRLKINNYTQNPVAPLIDLNLYKNNSGLNRRTFVGPCTLVSNQNQSELRPTDTVDEAFCDKIDCSEIIYQLRKALPDNSKFENSAHHDSLKPFASIHVDDIIDAHKKNERRYEMEMDAISQLGNFTKSMDLTYVSLTNEPIRSYKQGCSFGEDSDCFPETKEGTLSSQSFKDYINADSSWHLLNRYFNVHSIYEQMETNEEIIAKGNLDPLWENSPSFWQRMGSVFSSNENEVTKNYYLNPMSVKGAHTYFSKNDIERTENSEEYNSPVTDDIIKKWLAEGLKEINLEAALRICSVISKQSSENLIATGKIAEYGQRLTNYGISRTEQYLLHKCFSHIKYLPKTNEVYFDGIHFDRRFKIREAGSYEHIAGLNMNINVGVDFSVGSYQDLGTADTAGFNDAGIIGIGVAGLGAGLGLLGAPITVPMAVIGGAAVAATGGLLIASRATEKAEGTNIGQSTAVNAATFLVVQKADFEITIKEHEKCLILQMGREIIASLDPERLHLEDETQIIDQDVQRSLKKGFMICEGAPTKEDIKIHESYYYVTQHFTAGEMLDDVNLLNHVWLLSLRGKRDFNEFVRILKSKQIGKDGEVLIETIAKDELTDKMLREGKVVGEAPNGKVKYVKDLYEYPLSRLGGVYKQVTPTFPGLYSVPD